MDDRKFGDILADRRRALRKSIDQVSQATGLNHAAITAFESSNFTAMPAGYAQNMITTYSRYLGLDPSEMARLYHRQYERFEKNQDFKKAARRTSARLDDDSFEVTSRRKPSRSTQLEPKTSLFIDKAPTRKMNVDDDDYRAYRENLRLPRSSRNYFDYDPVDNRARQRSALETRDTSGVRYDDRRSSRRSTRGTRRSSDSSRGSRRMQNNRFSASSRFASLSADDKRRLIVIVAGLVALLVVLICVALFVRSLFANTSTDVATDDVSKVQSQLAQRNNPTPATPTQPAQGNSSAPSTNNTGDNQSSTTQPQIPTKTVVTYTVEPGKSTWIEVTVDGKNVFAGTANAQETKSFDVTGELDMTVSDPSAVKVTKNGEAVSLKESNGIATLKVKFADDLAEFKKKYPGAQPAASTDAGSGNATSTGE